MGGESLEIDSDLISIRKLLVDPYKGVNNFEHDKKANNEFKFNGENNSNKLKLTSDDESASKDINKNEDDSSSQKHFKLNIRNK